MSRRYRVNGETRLFHGHRAFVETHRDGAGHDFLGLLEERVERFSKGREPLPVINQLGVGDCQNVFVITRLAIENKRFELAMGRCNSTSLQESRTLLVISFRQSDSRHSLYGRCR